MQDSFLKVWERWDRVGSMDDPVGYLNRTAMNLFRKRYRRALLAIRRTFGLTAAPDDFADADDREVVRRVLSSLPPRQRAALVLTEMLGFTPDEAGRALGVQASARTAALRLRSVSVRSRPGFLVGRGAVPPGAPGAARDGGGSVRHPQSSIQRGSRPAACPDHGGPSLPSRTNPTPAAVRGRLRGPRHAPIGGSPGLSTNPDRPPSAHSSSPAKNVREARRGSATTPDKGQPPRAQ
jgi:Sigma-70, region 4